MGRPLPPVVAEKISQRTHGIGQDLRLREHHDPEAQILVPVKAPSGDHQNLLLVEEFQGKVLIGFEIVKRRVNARENIEAGVIRQEGDAGDPGKSLHRSLSLLVQPAAGHQHGVGAGVVAECCRNDQLGQGIAAQPHGGQLHDPIPDLGKLSVGAGEHHPAAAEAADNVGLGKTVEGNAGHIRRQNADGVVVLAVHDQPVVDFVAQQKQVMLPGKPGDAEKHLPAVDRAGGVVGVDHKDRLGPGRDLPLHIGKIREPVLFWVAAVEHRLAAADIDIVAPQRVAGGGNQNFVSVAHQRSHQHGDRFADTVADENILHGDTGHASSAVITQDRVPGGLHAPDIAVGDGLVHVLRQGGTDAPGQGKAEACRVSGVQLQHLLAVLLHPECLYIQRPPNVGVNFGNTVGFLDTHSASSFRPRKLPRPASFCKTNWNLF